MLEQCGLLSDEYHAQAQALQRHYYPLEVSPSLDPANKALLMLEWVTRAHALLLEAGLTGRIIRAATASAVGSGGLRLREGALSLLRALDRAEVPVLLLSAGIADVIEVSAPARLGARLTVLLTVRAAGGGRGGTRVRARHQQPLRVQRTPHATHTHTTARNAPNIPNAPNALQGDAVVGFSEPVLHVFNKRAANFLSTPFFSVPGVERRGNVLLLGDSIGDAHMADGLPCVSEVLRIGLLSDAEERLAEYLLEYDAVLLDDPSLEFVQKLVRELLGDA